MPGSNKNNKVFERSESNVSVKMEVLKLDNGNSNSNSGVVEEFLDPYCLENKPQKITFQDVTSAAFMIKGGVERTPCFVSIFCALFSQRSNLAFFVKSRNLS